MNNEQNTPEENLNKIEPAVEPTAPEQPVNNPEHPSQPNSFQNNLEQQPAPTPTPNMNPEPQSNYNEEVKSGKSKLPLIIVAIVLLAGIGFAIYYFLGQKNQTMTQTLNTSANKQIAKFNKMINDAKEIDVLSTIATNKGSAKLYLEFNSDSPSLAAISGYKLDIDAGYDSTKDMVALNAEIIDPTNNKLDIQLNGMNDKLYVDLGDIFDKTIVVSDFSTDGLFGEQEVTEETFDADDYAYLAEIIIDTITDTIKEEELTKETISKSIYSENLSLNKITYNLTKERFNQLYRAILNKFKSDDKALNILVKVSASFTLDELKANLDEYLKEEDLAGTDFVETTLSFYINNSGELVLTEIDNDDTLISFIAYKEKYTIKVDDKESSTNLFEISYDDKKDDVMTIKMDMEGTKVDLVINIVDKSSGNVVANDISIDGTVTIEGQQLTFNAIIKYEMDNEYNYPTPNLTNTVNYEDLTAYDMNLIQMNLMQNPIGSIFASF